MLKELLNQRGLPQLRSKAEMLDILLREEYGYLPPIPDSVKWEVSDNYNTNFCAGKATAQKGVITSYFGNKAIMF